MGEGYGVKFENEDPVNIGSSEQGFKVKRKKKSKSSDSGLAQDLVIAIDLVRRKGDGKPLLDAIRAIVGS